MGIKTKNIKTFYPMVDHPKTEKSKNMIPEKIRIHGNGEKTRDSTENCVEDMEQKSLPHL